MRVAAYVLRLVSELDAVVPSFTGTIAESAFLELLGGVDRGLSVRLHEKREAKPYACTPLFDGPLEEYRAFRLGDYVRIRAGSRLWFRVSLVGDYADRLLEALSCWSGELRLFNSRARLVEVGVRVVEVEELIERAASEVDELWDGGLSVKVSFYTPTRFSVAPLRARRGPKFSLFPEPERVFPNIARHWNEYSGRPVPLEEVYRSAVDYAYVADYRLVPVTLKMTHGRPLRGSVGYVIYRFTERSAAEVFLSLLRYGEFFNIGSGRSMGVGVVKVRPLPAQSSREESG